MTVGVAEFLQSEKVRGALISFAIELGKNYGVDKFIFNFARKAGIPFVLDIVERFLDFLRYIKFRIKDYFAYLINGRSFGEVVEDTLGMTGRGMADDIDNAVDFIKEAAYDSYVETQMDLMEERREEEKRRLIEEVESNAPEITVEEAIELAKKRRERRMAFKRWKRGEDDEEDRKLLRKQKLRSDRIMNKKRSKYIEEYVPRYSYRNGENELMEDSVPLVRYLGCLAIALWNEEELKSAMEKLEIDDDFDLPYTIGDKVIDTAKVVKTSAVGDSKEVSYKLLNIEYKVSYVIDYERDDRTAWWTQDLRNVVAWRTDKRNFSKESGNIVDLLQVMEAINEAGEELKASNGRLQ